MANQPLDLLAYPCSTKKSQGAGGTKKYAGYFTCRRSVARFLDIEALAEQGTKIIIVKRKAHSRQLSLADGTTLGTAGGEVAVGESKLILAVSLQGSRTVKLVTGKQTERKNYHQLSFRFPAFMTNKDIADALGKLIPTGKVSFSPGATEIKPFFITGSKRYGFMEVGAATSDTQTQILGDAESPENAIEVVAAAPEG